MSDLLFVTMDAGGNVPPMLGIAAAAARAGHRVRVLGHARLQDRADEYGLTVTPYEGTVPWDASRPQSPIGWARMLNDARIGAEVHHRCTEDRPDVAVVDCMLTPAQVAVQRLAIPRVVLTHTVKAFFEGTRYGLTAGGVSRVLGHDQRRLWRSADADLVATTGSLDLAARGDHAPNARWTGVVGPACTPARPPDGPPLVLASLSTNGFPGQRRTLRRIIEALGELPVRAVVTTGGVFDPSSFTAPDNVEVRGYADHLAILPECSAVIGHGGHSTTVRALAHDVPLVVVPASPITDQPFLARTVADAGAGVALGLAPSVRAIRDATATVLGESAFNTAAAEFGAEIRAVDGAANAVEHIAGVAAR